MKTHTNKILSFTVLYKKDPEAGYVAFIPSLPGCHTQGETIEETQKNVREAIEVYLESLKNHEEEIPQESAILQEMVHVSYPSSV